MQKRVYKVKHFTIQDPSSRNQSINLSPSQNVMGSNQRIPEIESVSLREFDLDLDIEWLVNQVQQDYKMSQDTDAQAWVEEILQPYNIENFLQEPQDIIAKVITDHLQRQSFPLVIESNEKLIGLIFISKPQSGVILLEKLYLNYVMILYNKVPLISKLLLDYLRAEESYKQKQKGMFSKLKNILWSFKFYIESIETAIQRDYGFQLIRNQIKNFSNNNGGLHRMYKFVISNPMLNQRIELIKEEYELLEAKHKAHLFNQRTSKKKVLILRDSLQTKINDLKKNHSPERVRFRSTKNKQLSKENYITRTPSLPNLKSSQNSATLNNSGNNPNQSFNSIQSAKSIGFNQKLFKMWHFIPSIQERFKISLSTHKDKFDLLQKQKQLLQQESPKKSQFYEQQSNQTSMIHEDTHILNQHLPKPEITNHQRNISNVSSLSKFLAMTPKSDQTINLNFNQSQHDNTDTQSQFKSSILLNQKLQNINIQSTMNLHSQSKSNLLPLKLKPLLHLQTESLSQNTDQQQFSSFIDHKRLQAKAQSNMKFLQRQITNSQSSILQQQSLRSNQPSTRVRFFNNQSQVQDQEQNQSVLSSHRGQISKDGADFSFDPLLQ